MPPKVTALATRVFASVSLRLALIAAVIALALNTYADFAVKGPLGLGFHFEGWKPKADRLQGTIDTISAAQELAIERERAARLKVERDYRNLAERIDHDAQAAHDTALADADRFIATHRVRCEAAGGSPGGTVAAAGDHGAQGGDGPRQTAELDAGLVAVPESDVRTCTANTARLVAVRTWALELERSSANGPLK